MSAGFSVSCSLLQDEMGSLSNVPKEYLDLKEVFSKSRAASLPHHRPYDCAIELVPGMSPPKGRLYSLSVPEREAMEKCAPEAVREWAFCQGGEMRVPCTVGSFLGLHSVA